MIILIYMFFIKDVLTVIFLVQVLIDHFLNNDTFRLDIVCTDAVYFCFKGIFHIDLPVRINMMLVNILFFGQQTSLMQTTSNVTWVT